MPLTVGVQGDVAVQGIQGQYQSEHTGALRHKGIRVSVCTQLLTIQMASAPAVQAVTTGKRKSGGAEASGKPLPGHCGTGCYGSVKPHCAGTWVITLCLTHSANTPALAQMHLWRLQLFPIPGKNSHKHGFLHHTLSEIFWHSKRCQGHPLCCHTGS